MKKGNPEVVSASAAKKALKMANGDKKAAYSQYVKLFYAQEGKFDAHCDNNDLQAFYEREGI